MLSFTGGIDYELFSELDIERSESGTSGDLLSAYVDIMGNTPAQETITEQKKPAEDDGAAKHKAHEEAEFNFSLCCVPTTLTFETICAIIKPLV